MGFFGEGINGGMGLVGGARGVEGSMEQSKRARATIFLVLRMTFVSSENK